VLVLSIQNSFEKLKNSSCDVQSHRFSAASIGLSEVGNLYEEFGTVLVACMREARTPEALR
jgi:hypothetical protein